jgi:hypothetical protein
VLGRSLSLREGTADGIVAALLADHQIDAAHRNDVARENRERAYALRNLDRANANQLKEIVRLQTSVDAAARREANLVKSLRALERSQAGATAQLAKLSTARRLSLMGLVSGSAS